MPRCTCGLAFNATKGYSLVDVKNTSSEDATFEVMVLWGFPCTDWGISIPALSQESFSVVRVAAQTDSQVQVTYYDGQNGGKPDASTPMVAYVLGNNSSGTFYVGKLVHTWSPSQVAIGGSGGGPRPMDLVPDNENPVTTYITPDATNQNYRARVFVVNPYGQQYSAIVTQALPAGAVVLATDGAVLGTSVVWTNLIPAGAVAMDTFTFELPVGPASINQPTSVDGRVCGRDKQCGIGPDLRCACVYRGVPGPSQCHGASRYNGSRRANDSGDHKLDQHKSGWFT